MGPSQFDVLKYVDQGKVFGKVHGALAHGKCLGVSALLLPRHFCWVCVGGAHCCVACRWRPLDVICMLGFTVATALYDRATACHRRHRTSEKTKAENTLSSDVTIPHFVVSLCPDFPGRRIARPDGLTSSQGEFY